MIQSIFKISYNQAKLRFSLDLIILNKTTYLIKVIKIKFINKYKF